MTAPPTHRSERRGRHGRAPTRTDSAHGNRRPTHHDRTCLTPASPIDVAGHAAIPQPVRAVPGHPAAAAVRLPGLIADCALRRRSARRTPRRGAHRHQVGRRQVGQTSGGADVRWGRRQGGQRSGSGDAVAAGGDAAVTTLPKPARPPACHVERTPGVSSATGHRARPADPRPHPRQRPSPAHSRTVAQSAPAASPWRDHNRPRPRPGLVRIEARRRSRYPPRPRPAAPSTAHRRCGHCRAHARNRVTVLRLTSSPIVAPDIAAGRHGDRGERALARVDPHGDQGCFRSPVMGSRATGNLTSGLITPVEPRRQRATAGATRRRPLPFPPDVGEPGSPGFEIRCRGGHLLVGHPRVGARAVRRGACSRGEGRTSLHHRV